LAAIVAVAGLIVECAALAAPAAKVTTEEDALTAVPTATAPKVAFMVAEPALLGAVNVAV
jgi:hypothetical protein